MAINDRQERIRRAVEAAAEALENRVDWPSGQWCIDELAHIAVEAAADILCPLDHLHYTIEFEAQ